MARKKAEPKQLKKKSEAQNAITSSRIADYFRFGESYTSLLLGMVIVILAIILVAALFRDRDFTGSDQEKDISATQTGPLTEPRAGATYTVQEGDTLWTISEEAYENGFLWEQVAEANNLDSPDDISAGAEITIPEVPATPTMPISPTTVPEYTVPQEEQKQQEINQNSSYSIRKGDTLWDISIRVYGDGYKWPQIAAHNNIPNPNIIYEGDTITFPRL